MLKNSDPEVYSIIKAEEDRQIRGLELIASENLTSSAVMEAVGSCLTNKYSEGTPGKRYYGGNEEIDKLEILCQKRALKLFNLEPENWHVNVQPYSGSIANLSAMISLLSPGDKIMGLLLSDGGHLSHGFKVNISAKFFNPLQYTIDPNSGIIDYDKLEKEAINFLPKLIVAGSSAYPRDWDYKRIKSICDKIGCKMMIDMAHYSGLVASGLLRNPFKYADIVTTTTHKSLRCTRSALIFCKKEFKKQVDFAVFPTTQGGPHNHAIAGVAVGLKEAMSNDFIEYSKQVIKNCQKICEILIEKGYKVATGGTDTHLLLWDLRTTNISGSKMEYICDLVDISLNKNTVNGDKSAFKPGGVRIGTPALTTRGMKEKEMIVVTDFLIKALKIAKEIQKKSGKKLKDFKIEANNNLEIINLREEVNKFARNYFMPGIKIN